MHCPSCNAQVDSGKFCPICGASLAAVAAAPGADAPAVDPLIGQSFGGKYRIVKLLGEGGMGSVYKGEQQLGTKTRNVAIKTLHPHLSKDPKILARFEREVGTIAELEHPNTIQVYDFGKTDGAGILYIVMEFVLGQNLGATIEKGGAMEPARVEKIMNQVCGSLEEAHGRGIVHRDLKPDNIVLTERAGSKDFVKVLDFGIAKRSNEEDKNEQKLTQQGMVLGTPPYMSPEQFTGNPIDARSDIYSLAIMAYEMLTANLPFAANTAFEWAAQHMTMPPKDIDQMPFHERIPTRMKDALRRALRKAPEDRFATVRDFFDAFSGGAAANATPVAPPAQPALGAAPAGAAKGRTEIATPLDYAGTRPSSGGYGAPPQAGTPALGNVAFPTPSGGLPDAPQSAQGGGGNRSILLGIAAVIGVLSVGAIGLALHGQSSPAPAINLVLDSGATPAVDLLAGVDAGSPNTAPVDTALGTLQPSGPGGSTHGAHPGTGKESGGKEPGGREAAGKDAGAAAVKEPGKEPVPVPPPIPPKGIASAKPVALAFTCSQASVMRRAGNVGAYENLKKLCESQGGTVPP
jgi:serine/threonine-protein kinase